MLIVHLSMTPLVGAPGAICRALNQREGVEARWAVLDAGGGAYEKMVFDLDLQWSLHKEQIVDLVQRCDVLHLHNYIGLDCKAFEPLDFQAMWDEGRPMVRHFHSALPSVARSMSCSEADVLACPIPKVVIAQYPERYYASARLVPNIVFVPPTGTRQRKAGAALRIGYAPSRFISGRASRWDTKGYPETVKMLRSVRRAALAEGLKVELDIIEQVSHAECISRKNACDIFVDDLVTGSYHLNTLEALAAGVACLTYLDRRTQQALVEVTGRADFPALSVGLESAQEVLLALCRQPEAVYALGEHSQQWMRNHWTVEWVASEFLSVYEAVQKQPKGSFPARFEADALAHLWLDQRLHDVLWLSRQRAWPKLLPAWLLAFRATVSRMLRKIGLIG